MVHDEEEERYESTEEVENDNVLPVVSDTMLHWVPEYEYAYDTAQNEWISFTLNGEWGKPPTYATLDSASLTNFTLNILDANGDLVDGRAAERIFVQEVHVKVSAIDYLELNPSSLELDYTMGKRRPFP